MNNPNSVELPDWSETGAKYSREGHDLHITGAHGETFVVEYYYLVPNPPVLIFPSETILKATSIANLQTTPFTPKANDLIPSDKPAAPENLDEAVEQLIDALTSGEDLQTVIANFNQQLNQGRDPTKPPLDGSSVAEQLLSEIAQGVPQGDALLHAIASHEQLLQANINTGDNLLDALANGESLETALAGRGDGDAFANTLSQALSSGKSLNGALNSAESAQAAVTSGLANSQGEQSLGNDIAATVASGEGIGKLLDTLTQGMSPAQAANLINNLAGN
ncbi:MAG: hypothetical protein HQL49_07955, partial [Gammaproteobacteria bacterium]|nr:hypothetical protein [Gammaproteobacteria bacterium]